MVFINGELGAEVPGMGYKSLLELSGEMMGRTKFNQSSATLEGVLKISVDVFGTERSIDLAINQTI